MMRTTSYGSTYDDDEILKDGEGVSVNLLMMDGIQREVAARSRMPLADAALHRPGWRTGGAEFNDAKAASTASYDQMKHATSNAWRRPMNDALDPNIIRRHVNALHAGAVDLQGELDKSDADEIQRRLETERDERDAASAPDPEVEREKWKKQISNSWRSKTGQPLYLLPPDLVVRANELAMVQPQLSAPLIRSHYPPTVPGLEYSARIAASGNRKPRAAADAAWEKMRQETQDAWKGGQR